MNTAMRIIACDPGTTYCGFSVLEVDQYGNNKLLYVNTVNAHQQIQQVRDISYIHGEKFARINIICNALTDLLTQYRPQYFVSEAAFYNPRRPGAYGPLVETIIMLRSTVYQFDPSLSFTEIPASIIKSTVGVKGTSGDKELIRDALLKLNLSYDGINLALLDEHSIDSIAIGYTASSLLNIAI